MNHGIGLLVSDPALLSSLRFSLSLEGFEVGDLAGAACLIIDQDFEGNGLVWLAGHRNTRNGSPAILLATNPDRLLRTTATALGARIVEKPLTGDDLGQALTEILASPPIFRRQSGVRH
jgi:hypothetical protein